MKSINRLKKVLFSTFFLTALFLQAQSNDWSPVLKEKIEKAMFSLYEAENIRFENAPVEKEANEDLAKGLHKFFIDSKFKGYIYVAQAPSMKNVFDYLVIFNPDLVVEKAKVLIYREQHGRQIGSARWLNQFKGMNTEDRPRLDSEIDGISGATISSKSMTQAINKLLTSLAEVKEKGIL